MLFAMGSPLIEVDNLHKEFRQGFLMRRVHAVRGISFRVESGDIFGFLGPNGAGKTTTLKVLTGLISPTSGRIAVFGRPTTDPRARTGLGFLPENPYVYPYLTPREFVQLCGSLSGLRGQPLRDRCQSVLAQVGMSQAADRPVRRLSKGMLQRTGLAAALVADPELLVLDEPMSGLDPIGRKEVRDLILGERQKGRTIFFSSHILGDVETLCDRVVMLRQGRVVVEGRLRELLHHGTGRTEVTLAGGSPEAIQAFCRRATQVRAVGDRWVLSVDGSEATQTLLGDAVRIGLTILEVLPRQETLEDLFLRHEEPS